MTVIHTSLYFRWPERRDLSSYPKRYYLGKQKRKEDFIPFEPVISKEGANSSLHLPVSIPLKYYHDIATSKEIDASLLVTIPLQHYYDAPACTLESLTTRLHAIKFEYPPGWVCIANTSTDLVVCQMDTELKQPLAVVTIRVAEDLHWSILENFQTQKSSVLTG